MNITTTQLINHIIVAKQLVKEKAVNQIQTFFKFGLRKIFSARKHASTYT